MEMDKIRQSYRSHEDWRSYYETARTAEQGTC